MEKIKIWEQEIWIAKIYEWISTNRNDDDDDLININDNNSIST